MSRRRVVVTGIGVVSPFGVGTDLFWRSLMDGRSGVRPIEGFDGTIYRSCLGAEVPRSVYADEALRQRCGAPWEDAAFFAAVAAEEALAQAGLGHPFDDDAGVGCVLGTLCSGVRNMIVWGRTHALDLPTPDTTPPRASLVSYQLEFLARRYNLTGPTHLVSTACASSTDALGWAAELVRTGACERALAGGADVLGEPIHGGFNSLFSITQDGPRPFDAARNGFAIGEGAGMLVLETLESAQARGAEILGEVLGYGLSNAAFHLTATSEDGVGERFAVERALADAGLTVADVDYVNAHGTATPHNDATEIKVLAALFGDRPVPVSSIKPAIGHCMGAAGILEAISTLLTLRDGAVPPTLNSRADAEGLTARIVTEALYDQPIRHAVSESFGFGGACSCVVLGRAPAAASAVAPMGGGQ